MSQRNSGYERKPDEAYDTPAWVPRVLAPYLTDAHSIWEPAPGKGQLAASLAEIGFDVSTTNDDFFLHSGLKVDAIVTNPPFGVGGKTAAMFARKAIAHRQIRYVALLMRIDFDSGKTRADLFRDCPTFWGKIVLLERIRWFPGESGPSDNHAWFCWCKDKDPDKKPSIQYARGYEKSSD